MILGLAAAAFVAGVGLGYYFVPGASTSGAYLIVGGCALCAGVSSLLLRHPRPRHLGWLLAALLVAGALRGYMAGGTVPLLPPELRSDSAVTLEGVLARDARPYGDSHVLSIEVDRYQAEGSWRPAGFRVDVVASHLSGAAAAARAPDGFLPGDRYLITGQAVSAAWSPAASRGSAAVVRDAEVTLQQSKPSGVARLLGSLRSRLGRSIDRTSPEPAAGLIKAMVTGERTGLSSETRDAFRRSGTSHVLSISGMHVGIVAVASIAGAAAMLGRRRQLYLLVPAAAVWGYAALAGFSPPVARAAIMASIFIGGRVLGRQRSVAPALGLAAAGMVVLDPPVLADVSFQLSFLAMFGLVVVTPGVARAGESLIDRFDSRLPECGSTFFRSVNSGVAMSVGAISLTGPLVAITFDSISIWGAPATLLQVPALPFLIVFGGLEAALGLVWHPIGVVAAGPAWALAGYVISIANLFARLPGGAVRPEGTAIVAAALYYAALAALLNLDRLRDVAASFGSTANGVAAGAACFAARPVLPHSAAPRLFLLASLGLAGLAWAGAMATADGRLAVTFFETEGGDSILIRTPSGRQVLIDGGDSSLGAVRALSSRMPFWDRSLDIVVLTHPHADHARGLLAVLERYRVDTILDSPSEYDSSVYREWLARTDAEGARRVGALAGTSVTLDRGVYLDVVFAQPEALAPDANDRSIVLRLAYGEAAFLFTGDLSSVAERRVIEAGLDVRAHVLKVGHQGSRGSSSNAFLSAVSPSIAVVPASIGNKFGHPHAEALERIAGFVDRDRILVTMDRGTVDIETDGHRYVVRTMR
ncbi:MAG: ComEC/Rec2 family competence protein [Chloroflexi bacterium]|nr:ComEC/Rec2 family competence protein [Chloroflexota bacterium]